MNPQRKAQWSWAFYDWANSAFATTVLAGFFPLFFNNYWAKGLPGETQTFWLGAASAAVSLVVMLVSPWLGAVADRRGLKKRFLAATTALGVLATAGLYLVGKGEWPLALLLFGLGSIGFFLGLCFYDALLVHVASAADSDRVSALGYGLGYLGGGLLFALNVAMALKPALFGLADVAIATRLSFLSVAVWWAAFALPLFLSVREDVQVEGGTPGWAALWQTLRGLRAQPALWMFLLAYWFYIDGVHTIIRMAVDFGQKLGFPDSSLITALLMVQFIGFPMAVLFGWLGGRIGTLRAIFIGLAVYAGITLWAYFLQTVTQFYLMAAAIGCVQGGVQSLSRSYFSRLVPPGKSGEYFGFYNMLGKFAAVLGPLLVGVTAALTGDPRLSILSILLLIAAGAALLWRAGARAPAGVAAPPAGAPP